MYSLAFVCTFPLLTGWPAAVLESLLTESVGSAGYFYPLACVREQVEALWATTRSPVTTAATPLSVAALAKRQGLRVRFTKTQHVIVAKGFTGRMEELNSKTKTFNRWGTKTTWRLILEKYPQAKVECRFEVFFMISTLLSQKSEQKQIF